MTRLSNPCSHCDATGVVNAYTDHATTCPECDGTASILTPLGLEVALLARRIITEELAFHAKSLHTERS